MTELHPLTLADEEQGGRKSLIYIGKTWKHLSLNAIPFSATPYRPTKNCAIAFPTSIHQIVFICKAALHSLFASLF